MIFFLPWDSWPFNAQFGVGIILEPFKTFKKDQNCTCKDKIASITHHTVDGRILHQLICKISHDLPRFYTSQVSFSQISEPSTVSLPVNRVKSCLVICWGEFQGIVWWTNIPLWEPTYPYGKSLYGGFHGFPKIVGFTPKSPILIGFSIIFTIHFGVPPFKETPIYPPWN